jgi:hypothetical protein
MSAKLDYRTALFIADSAMTSAPVAAGAERSGPRYPGNGIARIDRRVLGTDPFAVG